MRSDRHFLSFCYSIDSRQVHISRSINDNLIPPMFIYHARHIFLFIFFYMFIKYEKNVSLRTNIFLSFLLLKIKQQKISIDQFKFSFTYNNIYVSNWKLLDIFFLFFFLLTKIYFTAKKKYDERKTMLCIKVNYVLFKQKKTQTKWLHEWQYTPISIKLSNIDLFFFFSQRN